MKPLQTAGVVVALIAAIGGGAWSLDARWTPRAMFAGFQQQYQMDRAVDLLDRTNDRLWDVRQKLKKNPRNEELQKEKEDLEDRKYRLKKQIDKSNEGG